MYTGKQIQIDIDNRRYRKYSRLLYFIKLGDYWEGMSSVFNEVSVSKVKLKGSGFVGVRVPMISKTASYYTYRVYVRSDVKNVLAYEGNLKMAKIEAEKIGKYLGLKVVHYVEGNDSV